MLQLTSAGEQNWGYLTPAALALSDAGVDVIIMFV